jgi:hypothetical protein
MMAAVTPHLEREADPSETDLQRRRWDTAPVQDARNPRRSAKRPATDVFMDAEIDLAVLQSSHSELVRMAWLRSAVEERLQGLRYRAQAGNAQQQPDTMHEVYLVLDQPVGVAPLWNPPGAGTSKQFKLLSWTSKMGAPSFSLPAGPLEVGGSCPGAAGGQTIVPQASLEAGAYRVWRVTGQQVRLSDAVCQFCYATGGRYASGQIAYAQVLTYVWTKQALRDGSFFPTMDYAVKNAEYLLDGGVHPAQAGSGNASNYAPERFQGRFFRLHDSGDFFSREYLAAWKQIADANPDVTFWAPSRLWASAQGIEWVNEINAEPRNLIIRPSAFMVNAAPPRNLGPGWAQGSTVFRENAKPEDGPRVSPGYEYDWDCQAYLAGEDGRTCRNALAPDGREGCRACWVNGHDLAVNYTLH